MIYTEKKVVYKAFGLTIRSDIVMPELFQELTLFREFPDISIEICDLSNRWNELSLIQKKTYISMENLVMFYVPDIAIFCVQNGNEILISPQKKI